MKHSNVPGRSELREGRDRAANLGAIDEGAAADDDDDDDADDDEDVLIVDTQPAHTS